MRTWEHASTPPRQRRRALAAGVVLVLVGALLGTGGLLDLRQEPLGGGEALEVVDVDEQEQGRQPGSEPSGQPTPAAGGGRPPGTWTRIPPPPIAGRVEPVVVWSGTEAIVWGGDEAGRPRRDGAAFDPTASAWRKLAPAPVATEVAAAAWTGSHLVVLLEGGAGALRYEPERDAWERLGGPPVDLRDRVAVGVAGRFLLIGLGGDGVPRGFALGAQGWQEIATPPVGIRPPRDAVRIGDDVVVAGGAASAGRLARYEAGEDAWHVPVPVPDEGAWQPTLGADEARERVLLAGPVEGRLSEQATFTWSLPGDAPDAWRSLEPLPLTAMGPAPALWGTGEGVLAWDPDAAVGAVLAEQSSGSGWQLLAEASGSWRGARPLWTGEVLLLVGGPTGTDAGGLAWRPLCPRSRPSPSCEPVGANTDDASARSPRQTR